MEKIRFVVGSKIHKSYSAELVVYCVGKTNKDTPDCSSVAIEKFQRSCELKDFSGEAKDTIVLYGDEAVTAIPTERVAILGTGIITGKIKQPDTLEKLRRVGGEIAALCRKMKVKRVCIVIPDFLEPIENEAAYCLTEGLLLGNYNFLKYKTYKVGKKPFAGVREVRFVGHEQIRTLKKYIDSAHVSCTATCMARDMANEPGSNWTPKDFADFARELAKETNLTCKVLEKRDMVRMGMGGILAVNRGSATPPKMIVLRYTASKDAPTVAFVGKGLTFDSGGVSLKPAAGMEDMKFDMCGGAAVLGVMYAIAKEQPSCNVIAVVPATDNMSGADALKPGDIITHYNGTTSEIINTDAEGRLILADALAYTVEQFSPDYIVDLATLTGAVIVGLGHHYCGLFSNDDKLSKMLINSGESCGEPLWRMPLGEMYSKQIESKIADIKNTGGKGGGAITGAEYLHKFVGKTPWAHLDIAGTAWCFTEKSYIPETGASGFGVRTLLQFVKEIR